MTKNEEERMTEKSSHALHEAEGVIVSVEGEIC